METKICLIWVGKNKSNIGKCSIPFNFDAIKLRAEEENVGYVVAKNQAPQIHVTEVSVYVSVQLKKATRVSALLQE